MRACCVRSTDIRSELIGRTVARILRVRSDPSAVAVDPGIYSRIVGFSTAFAPRYDTDHLHGSVIVHV